MKYTVTTDYDEDLIRQAVWQEYDGVRTQIFMSIMNTREEQIRAALIRMGWTPPTEKK